ncbi:hypothetical protein B9Z55_012373 [Caenorhabditis nigoni]|uniref:Uncharacterized protein n=1 Tax=Caenorhabditis nigoni TaxID=1611254 RepID=A0A2G5TX11_9PELO|nr:hypothetical protein B9Z55_012373 [Caenorhabditis nigoni]
MKFLYFFLVFLILAEIIPNGISQPLDSPQELGIREKRGLGSRFKKWGRKLEKFGKKAFKVIAPALKVSVPLN